MTQTSTEPEKITVTRYRCPHCRRSWTRRSAAVAHIARCWSNPDAKNCRTCAYFIPANTCDEPTCGCGGEDEECTAGVDLTQYDREGGPRDLPVGCPKWAEAPR